GGTSLGWGTAISVGAATAAGSALGIAAGVARGTYDGLVTEVKTKKEFEQKRIAYSHDLGALDSLMKFSLPASNGLINQLGVARDAWESSIREISATISDLDANKLKQGPWLRQNEMDAAAANWTSVDKSFRAFTVGSFVDYDIVDFGSPLPKDDPQWLEKFVKQVAA
ncbi:MAG: hypothetical protein ABI619_10330, partial [Betaproteobacteria bacterium]